MTGTKQCTGCQIEKPLSAYSRNRTKRDGYQGECKSCKATRQRVYQDTPAGKKTFSEAQRRYRSTKNGRLMHVEAHMRDYRRHKMHHLARARLRDAVLNGKIIREPCELCGEAAEAHHDDYSRPLDVRWLCRKHHVEHHNAIR